MGFCFCFLCCCFLVVGVLFVVLKHVLKAGMVEDLQGTEHQNKTVVYAAETADEAQAVAVANQETKIVPGLWTGIEMSPIIQPARRWHGTSQIRHGLGISCVLVDMCETTSGTNRVSKRA